MRSLINIIAITALLLSYQTSAETHGGLYFVDAHSQIDHKVNGVETILTKMSSNNVRTTLLATRGKRSWQDILRWNSKYPTEIKPLVRSKGKHYQANSKKYYKIVQKQIGTGKFVGAAEILVFHAKKGNKAPEVEVNLDDDRVSLLLTESLRLGWPMIIHIEFASLQTQQRKRHFDDLHSLLARHPNHPFILIHMGQLQPNKIEELINRHTNIYFLTSHSDPATVKSSNQPWVNLFSNFGNSFKESWKKLFIAYPERFVFALDNVWDYHWHKTYDEKIKYWRSALSELPGDVSHLIAHGNAERLWKLN